MVPGAHQAAALRPEPHDDPLLPQVHLFASQIGTKHGKYCFPVRKPFSSDDITDSVLSALVEYNKNIQHVCLIDCPNITDTVY